MAKGPVSKIGGAHAPSGFESQRLRHTFKDTKSVLELFQRVRWRI